MLTKLNTGQILQQKIDIFIGKIWTISLVKSNQNPTADLLKVLLFISIVIHPGCIRNYDITEIE